MSKVEGLQEFMQKMDNVTKAYNRIPSEVAAIAVNFSKERFRDQAWLDVNREPWKPRARRRDGKTRSQTLLVDKGYLKRSIRKILANHERVIIGTDAPYAQIQNDGGRIKQMVTVRSHSRTRKARIFKVRSYARKMNLTIPARPFLRASEALNRRIFIHVYTRFEDALIK